MHANEARKITDENCKLEFTHTIFDVYQLIEKESKQGKSWVEFQGNISETECNALNKMGYNVFWFHKLGKGITFKISWGCYRENITD